jgi:predicted dehydrogenase
MIDRLAPRGLAEAGPICARRRASRDRILVRRPGARLTPDPEDVLSSEVDVVAVLTSADAHAPLAARALEAGKHVLVEKPLAGSREEGVALAELARDRGRYLVAAPFVQLAPTFRAFGSAVRGGAIGRVHTARGLYGVPPPDWNTWMRAVGPLVDVGIYNLKSLTALLGPVVEVVAAESGTRSRGEDPADAIHVVSRHEGGALSSVVAGWEIHAYRRPALELYGTAGTANLLGDDWDPRGYEIYRPDDAAWHRFASVDPTWLWTDGLRDLVDAVLQGRAPIATIDHDLHLLEVVAAARTAASERAAVPVTSRFDPVDLQPFPGNVSGGHIHDHTRSPEEQR